MQNFVVVYADSGMTTLVGLVAIERADSLKRAIRQDIHFCNGDKPYAHGIPVSG